MSDEKMQEYIQTVLKWIKKIVTNAHMSGAIIGISGGIDSAVVAFLLHKALNGACYGLIMPCYSDPRDQEDAMLVIAALKMNYGVINLDKVFDECKNNFESLAIDANPLIIQTALNNVKARLRMVTLYNVGQSLNYLVAGTDNWVENYTGYFTKYGDGGVDFLPISQLTKGEVRQMARLLKVPQKIIDKTPAAGLIKGVSDEDELDVSYAELDKYLLGQKVSIASATRINHLHQVSGHKRRLPPKPQPPKRF